MIHRDRSGRTDRPAGTRARGDGQDPSGEGGRKGARCLHIGERITRDGSLRDPVHQHIRHLIAGRWGDREGLRGTRVHQNRPGRTDRPVRSRAGGERVHRHGRKAGGDRLIRDHIAEGVAGDRPQVDTVDRQSGQCVSDRGLGDEGRTASVGHAHRAGRAQAAAGASGSDNAAEGRGAEPAGEAGLKRLALRVAESDPIQEGVPEVTGEGGPTVRIVAAEVDMIGERPRHSRHQRGHRAGGVGGVDLRPVGEDLELSVRLADQAEHRHLAVGKDRPRDETGPVAVNDDLSRVVQDPEDEAVVKDIDDRVPRVRGVVADGLDHRDDARSIARYGRRAVVAAVEAIAVGPQGKRPLRVAQSGNCRRGHRRIVSPGRQVARPGTGGAAGRQAFHPRRLDQAARLRHGEGVGHKGHFDAVVAAHVGEGITRDRTLLDPVHPHATDAIAAGRSDGEGLAGPAGQ